MYIIRLKSVFKIKFRSNRTRVTREILYHRSLSSKSSLPFGAYAIRSVSVLFDCSSNFHSSLSLPLFLFLTHSLPHFSTELIVYYLSLTRFLSSLRSLSLCLSFSFSHAFECTYIYIYMYIYIVSCKLRRNHRLSHFFFLFLPN